MIRMIEVARVSRLAIITVSAGLTVQLLAIPVGQRPDQQLLAPGVIASTATVRAPIVQGAAVTAPISPAFIASSAGMLLPAIQPGTIAATPAIVGPTASLPAASLAVGDATVRPTTLASTVVIGAPSVLPGSAAVNPSLVASGAVVPAPAVIPGPASIAPPAVARTSTVATPAVAVGAVSIAPTALARTSTVASPTVAVASGYDTDSSSYFAAMAVQPDATRKGLINDLIVGLKSDGVWSSLDWLVMLAAHDAQAGRLNARVPSKLLGATNSPAFTTDRGYSGDGSTSFLDFGEAFNATGNLYALNSGTLGVWCNQQNGGTGTAYQIGSSQSTRSYILASDGGTGGTRMNDSSSMTLPNTGTRTGHRTSSRTAATTRNFYQAGAVAVTDAAASSAVATGPAYLLRSGATYAADRLAAAYSGAGLTGAQVTSLHNRLNTFLTAIGAN